MSKFNKFALRLYCAIDSAESKMSSKKKDVSLKMKLRILYEVEKIVNKYYRKLHIFKGVKDLELTFFTHIECFINSIVKEYLIIRRMAVISNEHNILQKLHGEKEAAVILIEIYNSVSPPTI